MYFIAAKKQANTLAGDISPLSFQGGLEEENSFCSSHSTFYYDNKQARKLPASIYTLVRQTVVFVVALEIENGMSMSGENSPSLKARIKSPR